MGNSSVMQKRSPLCSMRHSACIFSIMVSMLVRPTFVLSVRCWPGRTAFSKASPALPFSLTKRTEMSCAGSAYLSRFEVMLSRMRRTYCSFTVRVSSSSPSSRAQAKPRSCSSPTISVSGSSNIWEKRAGGSRTATVSRVTRAYSKRLSDSCLSWRALVSILAR